MKVVGNILTKFLVHAERHGGTKVTFSEIFLEGSISLHKVRNYLSAFIIYLWVEVSLCKQLLLVDVPSVDSEVALFSLQLIK